VRWLPLIALLLAACTPKGPSAEVAARLAAFDSDFQTAWRETRSLRERGEPGRKDMRGKTIADDIEQWIFTPETEAKIHDLVGRASRADGDSGNRLLDEAQSLIAAERWRASHIDQYWASTPTPYWRRYWQAFFEDNGFPVEEPDARLVEAEKPVTAALERGDFVEARSKLPALANAYFIALNDVGNRIYTLHKNNPPPPELRKSPCKPDIVPARGTAPARVLRGDDIDSIYPRRAKDRSEQGSVILQLRILANGCATSAILLMRSGIPELDAAALQWYETAQFAPSTRDGVPYESDYRFKMKFVIRK
jgi:TonB family protein